MKHTRSSLLLAAFLLVSSALSAAPNTVMVVFNGNTEANRHVFNFLSKTLGQSAGSKVQATLNPSSVKPGQYKAVIVVSTKPSAGIDPLMAQFVASYAAPQELYVVSLLSRTGSLTVTPFTAASSPLKVDGVTAATTWSRGSEEMHNQWMQELVDALAAR